MKTLIRIIIVFVGFPLVTFSMGAIENNSNMFNEKSNDMKTTEKKASALYQVRIYELNEHNKEQFLIRFRDHAARIMKRHGFDIIKMWESSFNGIPEFVYLLKWENEEALKQGWEKFFTDKEWIEIRDSTTQKYGMLVGDRIEDRLLKVFE